MPKQLRAEHESGGDGITKREKDHETVEIVLLGAGASIKAGVPAAYDLTDAVVAARVPEFGDILAYIIGALQFQKGIEGNIPLGKGHRIDIESLANAIELLTARNTLEIAPFVASWHPRLFQVEGQAGSHRQFGAFSSRFDALKKLLPRDVFELAEAPEVGAGDYLLPLLHFRQARSSRFTIATLNYDCILEKEAALHDIPIDIGLQTWIADGHLGPSGKGVFLLKLHGSVDWWYDIRGKVVRPRPAPEDSGPALLFGGRNKLTAKGPFLDLLMAFRQELEQADRLTVVGYSFRDEHVNEYIGRWFDAASFRRLRVIDPDVCWRESAEPYLGDTRIPVVTRSIESIRSRVELIPHPAEEVLGDAFPE